MHLKILRMYSLFLILDRKVEAEHFGCGELFITLYIRMVDDVPFLAYVHSADFTKLEMIHNNQ